MYYSSLRTEESEAISFHIVYLDPQNADPDPPSRITNDRWIITKSPNRRLNSKSDQNRKSVGPAHIFSGDLSQFNE
jgi:hypothetical protein